MRLQRLLAALPDAVVSGNSDPDITDIAYDSRRVVPGSLFVVMPSLRHPDASPEPYLREAIERGAAAVVRERGSAACEVTTVQVPNARAALADLSAEFFGHPSRRLALFAVTGTDGKTTTTYLLEQVLAHAGLVTGLVGTVEIKIGQRRESNLERMTTPESYDLQRLLRQMVDAGVTHAALEASSHALALDRLRGCQFAACGLTNITADHLEFHGSAEAYFRAKSSLFTVLAPGQPAILNRDDDSFARLAPLVSGPLVSYGLGPEAELRATQLEIAPSGTSFTLEWREERARAALPLPGIYNVSNALAACGLALTAGLSLDLIANALSHAQPPPGRLQRVAPGLPFEVVVDYAHTPYAFRAVLATLRQQTRGRLIAVFGAAGDRDRAKRPLLGQIARQYADFFIITDEDPCSERPDEIIDAVASALPSAEEGIRFQREPDRGQAIRAAIARARPGDTVAILGKGHEQSMVVGQRKEPWSDVTVAREALQVLR